MKIAIVLGTARVNNNSARVAQAIYNALSYKSVDVTRIDVAEELTTIATTPPWGEGGADTVPTRWKETVEAADRLVFVLPEYNHSFPGEWKLLMDSLYKEYIGKQAFVAAVASGDLAGTRVMEHVMPVLVNFQFAISPARLHVAKVTDMVAEDGTVTDAAFGERLEKFADAIAASA